MKTELTEAKLLRRPCQRPKSRRPPVSGSFSVKHLLWKKAIRPWKSVYAVYHAKHPDFLPHDHDFFEMVVIVGGSGLQRTSEGERRIGPGDVFLFHPRAWHSYSNCMSLRLYNCCFDPGLLGQELAWMRNVPSLNALLWSNLENLTGKGVFPLQLPKDELHHCSSLLRALCSLGDSGPLIHAVEEVGLLTQVLGLAARCLPGDSLPAKKAAAHPAALAALRAINQEPARAWTLKSLSEIARVDPVYLVRIFRVVAGLPPMHYLNRRRLEMAANLLLSSDIPIGEVGLKVGWCDANYFTRRFHAQFGLSPMAYRNQLLKERDAFGGSSCSPIGNKSRRPSSSSKACSP